MSKLALLQESFQQLVLRGHGPAIELFFGANAPDFDARLLTYSNGYRARLVEALGVTYPGVQTVLGSNFESTMMKYVEQNASTHFSIRYYGRDLSQFLANERDIPFHSMLADLAAFEWLLAEAFDAADDNPVGMESLAVVPAQDWGEVSFEFRGALRLLTTHSNAVQIWQSLKDDGEAMDPVCFDQGMDWLIWRKDLATYFRSIEALELRTLLAARRGASFSQLCELIAAETNESEAPLKAASLLRGWYTEELIQAVKVP